MTMTTKSMKRLAIAMTMAATIFSSAASRASIAAGGGDPEPYTPTILTVNTRSWDQHLDLPWYVHFLYVHDVNVTVGIYVRVQFASGHRTSWTYLRSSWHDIQPEPVDYAQYSSGENTQREPMSTSQHDIHVDFSNDPEDGAYTISNMAQLRQAYGPPAMFQLAFGSGVGMNNDGSTYVKKWDENAGYNQITGGSIFRVRHQAMYSGWVTWYDDPVERMANWSEMDLLWWNLDVTEY